MDNYDQDDIMRIVAQRSAQIKQQNAQKAAEEKKSGSAGPRLFYDTTYEREKAERIAKVWFPLLREIFPESVGDESRRKELFARMFKKKEAYISRQWMRDLHKALKNSNWGYLTGKDVGLNQKEKEILQRSDTKRHRFMEIIVQTTNISM